MTACIVSWEGISTLGSLSSLWLSRTRSFQEVVIIPPNYHVTHEEEEAELSVPSFSTHFLPHVGVFIIFLLLYSLALDPGSGICTPICPIVVPVPRVQPWTVRTFSISTEHALILTRLLWIKIVINFDQNFVISVSFKSKSVHFISYSMTS